MPIRQLAPDVAAKIAAGEVVERPASVVKELLENSIDAGASQIRIDLTHGGLQLIRITDNGSGIAADELSLALERHATSKVAQIDDLEHIRSLGFRGEALASVAAVAEVTLLSRQRGANQGAQISARDGLLSSVTAAASPEGTTLTVRNLFSTVPARLKFLKSRNTEVSHCHHLLEQYALAYPEIRFSVFSEGRQIFATAGDGQLFSVLVEVYGLQIAEQMVAMEAEQSGDAEYPVVSGYVSRPTAYKSTRQYISFFVNRRWVLSRMLTAAVEGAYHSLLLTGRHPLAVVNIQLDPSLLDVNVHPAKTEIRFLKERRVFAAVLRAVRKVLLEEPEMPQWQPKQAHDAPVTHVDSLVRSAHSNELSDEGELATEIFATDQRDDPTTVDRTSHTETPSTFPLDSPWVTVAEEETGSKPPMSSRLWQSHIRTPEGQDVRANRSTSSPPLPWPQREDVARTSDAQEQVVLQSSGSQEQLSWEPSQPSVGTPQQNKEHVELTGESIDPQRQRRLPHLRVVGQMAQSYIVTEGAEGMYLIDQHAAHERILLERMVASMKARTPLSQLLLTPLKLELAPGELEAIEEHQKQLEQIGFSLQPGDDGTLDVQAVPSVLVKQMNMRSLHELMQDLTSTESLGDTETWEERALANVACKAAIKANYFLTVSEMREMLEQLEQTRAPYSCCHGRPTMVHFSLPALAHAFERR